MSNGTVKWFSDRSGFGFLQQDDGPDVFVHSSSIKSEGLKSLKQGEQVIFEVIHENRRLIARNVIKL